MKIIVPLASALLASLRLSAHDLSDPGDDHAHAHDQARPPTPRLAAPPMSAPPQAASFALFAPSVKTRWDEKFLYIESNGLPAHNMMVGITAWQQQVPLPQNYSGANAWRLPLAPVPAKQPAAIRDRFLRGAIAIAANGIPIFNPQNNRGEISLEIGELDEWGGHCGRADDYHYHVAPLHLQKVTGSKLPIAHALDGYPVYGLTEPDGAEPKDLDAFNGHGSPALGYHYHASKKFPFVMGGFHGEVTERDGQVDPQPRATPVRESLQALRGARIIGFEKQGAAGYKLTYAVDGETLAVAYTILPNGSYQFQFEQGSKGKKTEVYTPREGGREKGGPPRDGEPNRRPRPPREDAGAQPATRNTQASHAATERPALRDEPHRSSGQKSEGDPAKGMGGPAGLIKPTISDTMKLNVYADNWFMLYVNGRLVAVDPIEFTPHNVVSIDFLPEYPMTIAVLAKDNADPKTGMEYGTSIGDGGFILKFADGTVTNAQWKAKSFSHGPLKGETRNPRVISEPLPDKWWEPDFDDSRWPQAKEYRVEEVDPKKPYFEHDFQGAAFIWTSDLALDNTVIFRTRIEKPGWSPRWNTRPDLDVKGVDAGASARSGRSQPPQIGEKGIIRQENSP